MKLWTLLLYAMACLAVAQDPAEKARAVKITFLPPPMEGTISLGVFDRGGKLVRTLKREATDADFTVGLNGLITFWDGKQDDGVAAPAGSYRVRGFCVGELEVEGVAFHGNDWVTNEKTPRVAEVRRWRVTMDGRLFLSISEVPGGESTSLFLLQEDGTLGPQADGFEGWHDAKVETVPPEHSFTDADVPSEEDAIAISGTRVMGWANDHWFQHPAPGMTSIADACIGRDDTLWLAGADIDGNVVRQYSAAGEILREQRIAAGEPAPVALVLSHNDRRLTLLEKGEGVERVRRVERTDGDGVSQWRTLFSKQLRHTPDVASATPLLPPLFKAGPVATVRLQANPLLREEAGTVQVGIAVDGTGSFLRTVDGLALCTVAETPRLRWAILGRTPGGKSWTAFQSDGLVVEEFRIDLLARMMAFDAGEYEWR